jgi:neutral ceramidase
VRKIFRILLYSLLFLLLCVVIFLLVSVQPVDRTPYSELSHYSKMMGQLDSVALLPVPAASHEFRTGYASVNLTPSFPVATAGYGKRRGKEFTSVYDSLYVRTVVIDNGAQRIAVVSADLLIMPPTVTELLESRLSEVGFSLENTYLNATHTHNSIGNWGEGATGIIYGSYSDSVVTFIAERILQCIAAANRELVSSHIRTGSIMVPSAVRNRLDREHGSVDSLLHVIEIERADERKLVITSFNAHATCLYSDDFDLSRDYPGALVDSLESMGYDFAMFLAGAVGSHGLKAPEAGKVCLGWVAEEITNKFRMLQPNLEDVHDSTLMMVRVPLFLGEAQVKLTADWRIRPWLFRSAFGEYQPYLTALRIGDIILMGTPCDFSGELTGKVYAAAEQHGMHAIVTSFNGHYIGYITADKYYDRSHYETRLMNWYGPGNGAYLTESLVKLQKALY